MNPFEHQSRYYKAEDFQPDHVARYFWILILILLIAILCMIAYALGDKRGFENGKKHSAIATRIVPAVNPQPPLINCADPIQSREEVSRICRHRWKSAQIGGR